MRCPHCGGALDILDRGAPMPDRIIEALKAFGTLTVRELAAIVYDKYPPSDPEATLRVTICRMNKPTPIIAATGKGRYSKGYRLL